MIIKSDAFKEGECIPERFTCEGLNISPPIRWCSVPPKTKSFVLIMEDTDSPLGIFTHWIVYDIPGSERELPENFPKEPVVGLKKQGVNDFGKIGYGGPCPPRGHGKHKYKIKLFALNIESLDLEGGESRERVEKALSDYIITEATLTFFYHRL